ncbi:unnamed protein product [Spodoptera littoralis]|uniref:Uncharacterized protein n=1 Tax=Spodoptera littoralis TaxID=7109 RepID=A0A9P0IA94_SPOLI|nr:unnamed protein product [Spodoptera littoralis]CAH1642210.1 unnamed protein product [Spodoptera littoralis]
MGRLDRSDTTASPSPESPNPPQSSNSKVSPIPVSPTILKFQIPKSLWCSRCPWATPIAYHQVIRLFVYRLMT